jgi:hypothetical protein
MRHAYNSSDGEKPVKELSRSRIIEFQLVSSVYLFRNLAPDTIGEHAITGAGEVRFKPVV